MRIQLDDDRLEVCLSPWQKALGLMGNISVARSELANVSVVEDPIAQAMSAGTKVGLRLPWLYFVARTIALDRAFVVRRGVPALSFSVNGRGRLREVLVSTREATSLAKRLSA